MKYLLLGAGLQGTAIAFDLLNTAAGTTGLTVVDADKEAIARFSARFSDERLKTLCGDVTDEALMGPLMKEADCAISAVNYWYNYELAALAVTHKAHFLDLGGNNDVVEREFSLDEQARAQGVCVIPDCGLAPGLAGILGHYLHSGFDEVKNLRLRVGGLPQDPQPPMNYRILFAVQGLINEYIEDCVVIRDNKIGTVPGMSELESLSFPEPFGEMEAFQTSGGTSTLPRTLAGRVTNLDYKTIRYPGHCEQIRLLMALGLTGSEEVEIDGAPVVPRKLLGTLMQKNLGFEEQDVSLVLVEAEGRSNGSRLRRRLRIIDRRDEENGISSMARMTGYPVAIIAWMLASGLISDHGARPQELAVPAEDLINELERRNINLEREQEEWT